MVVRITDEQANAFATQGDWPLGETTITQALMWLAADLLDARTAIKLHRARITSLGCNVDRHGNLVHGGEWDRELWTLLADHPTDEMPDPRAITSSDLKTMVMQEETEQRAHWTKVIHYPANNAEQRDGWGIECQVCDYACGPFGSFNEADEYARKHEATR